MSALFKVKFKTKALKEATKRAKRRNIRRSEKAGIEEARMKKFSINIIIFIYI